MSIHLPASIEAFAASYPEVPHKLAHTLHTHPLLTLEALAGLADSLPSKFIECNLGNQPIGVDRVPEQLLENVGERILNIDTAESWIALREVDRNPAYKALLHELLEEMRPDITERTGSIYNVQGFIFITSPGGVTPYHFDPEHNILFQVRGSKTVNVFPAGDTNYAPDEYHEIYHTGGRPELPWKNEMAAGARRIPINAGEAVYIPVMAPHFVQNGGEVSISISVTWKSEWCVEEADARGLNRLLRKAGFKPAAPRRWPHRNRPKSFVWRALRKIGAAG